MQNIYDIMNNIDDEASLKQTSYTKLSEKWSTNAFRRKKRLTEAEEAPLETSNATAASGEDTVSKLHDADYEQFVTILNSDRKSQAFLKFLQDHYKMGDDALGTIKKATASETTLTCKDLQPTQKNISVEKSLGMITKGGWSVNIIKDSVNAFSTPTVTYAGKYIIDGHHRWSKIVALHGPDSKLKVLDFPAISGLSWEDMLKAVELAIVATNPSQNLVTPVPNDNMLSPEGAKLAMNFYNEKACEEVVTAMKEIGKGETKEEQAKSVGRNIVETMSATSPVQGAQKRDFMPQMDDDGKAKAQLINNGVVDMTEELN